MKQKVILLVSAGLYSFIFLMLLFWDTPTAYLADHLRGYGIASYIAFVLLFVVATVFPPITIMPIIPLLAPVFGPFMTGVLSIIGWTLGAMCAFLIARYLGRPLILRYISMKGIDKIVAYIPSSAHFLVIIIMRMTLPVDLASYALGFTRTVRFVPYTIATALGVSYFSFVFAYAGDAFFEHNIAFVGILGIPSFVVFALGWYLLIRTKGK